LKGNTSLVTYFSYIPPWEWNWSFFLQENCSTTFIQSLSEVICACVIWVGELDRCQFFWGGQMIGIDLLSSCIDFNDKAATVFRVFMFNCMGSKTLFLKVLSKIYAWTTIATSVQRCYASSFSHSSINFSFSWWKCSIS